MKDRSVKSTFFDYAQLSHKSVFFIIFVLSVFIRLPFFFRDYIDRDESTFILIGQSWVDGFLPYTELWDIKPPITFLFFAGIIYFFGKSFFAIRFIGALIVAVTAFFTYRITDTLSTKKVALWSGLFCVVLLSLFGSIQGVMSEHIVMFFFMPALYIILTKKNTYWYIITGLFMGLALMTKLNIAYVVLFLGLFNLYQNFISKSYTKGILNAVAYGVAIIGIILLTVLPYHLAGDTEMWYRSVVQAALEYAGARRESIWKMAPTLLPILLFFIFAWKRKSIDFKDPKVQILVVAVVGVLLSFIKGGRINSHYLIQLYPVLIVLVAVVIEKISLPVRTGLKPFLPFLLLLVPAESYLEYFRIVKNKVERGTFFNGEGITVPKYIRENDLPTENILFLEYHIGYWMLDKTPPTKAATHPSNICKPEMFPFYDNPRKTGLQEITYIMEEIKPKTVVIRKGRTIFDPQLIEENGYINSQLQEYYKKPITVDLAEIYVRSN